MSAPSKLIGPGTSQGRTEFESAARHLVDVLVEIGVRPADRVALLADNSPRYVAALFALMHLDTSIALLDRQQTAQERARAIRAARVRWVLHDVLGDDDRLVAPDRVGAVPLGAVVEQARRRAGTGGRLDFADWARRWDGLIAWSSGTTGAPKAIVRSGRAIMDNIRRTRRRMGYRPDDVLLPLLPFSHQYGLSLLLLWWTTGCSLALCRHTHLTSALHLIAQRGVSVVDAVPSTYHSLLNIVDLRPGVLDELRGVRMWCVGGSPLSPALAARFERTVGLPLLDGYGSTEAGNIALATAADPTGSGRPLDGVEVQVRDDAGRPAAANALGSIHVRSPDLMEGYLAADGTFLPAPDVLDTGDYGYRDTAGNLVVLGRTAAVHRYGYTVYPAELSRRVEALGHRVEVVPVADERRGCDLVFVVADPTGRGERQWHERVRPLLASYEQPNRVLVLDELPLTRTGKVDRRQLERLVMDSVSPPPQRHSPGSRAEADVRARPTGAGPAPPGDHVDALRAVADHVRDNRSRIRAILCEVATYRAAEEEIRSFLGTLDGAAEEVARYRPGPVDRVAVFMPSNVLLYSYALYVLVPTLFSTEVRFRPSGHVGDQTRRLHEELAPVHRLPVHFCPHSQQEFLEECVADADVVVFTGAYNNAESVRATLRRDQLFVYFGHGVNPFVVTENAELDHAIADAVRVRLFNSGQDCFGPDVFFVHSGLLEEFVGRLGKRLAALRFGARADLDADYGPLCYDSALENAAEFLRRNGEHIVHGGQVNFRTRRVEPTVLVRGFTDKLSVPELFAPIFNIVSYDDVEALRRRLDGPFFSERAMAAMVYGDDPRTVELLSRKHTTYVNSTILDHEDGNTPFGGYGVMANYAAHGGSRVAEPLLLSKTVAERMTRTSKQEVSS